MIFSFLLYCTIIISICQCLILFILMGHTGIEPVTFRLWGECSTTELMTLWWLSYNAQILLATLPSNLHNIMVKHYPLCNQYVVNCPNWNRTNITRVKFLCASLYTIEHCFWWLLYSPPCTDYKQACVLTTLTPVKCLP